MPMRLRRLTLVLLAAVGATAMAAAAWPKVSALVEIARHYGFRDAVDAARRRLTRDQSPTVAWQTSAPESAGFSQSRLDSLRAALSARGLRAFLVVRHGKLAYEWYAPGISPNTRHGTASLAKAVVGTTALLSLAADGVVALDEPAHHYITAWRNDPVRANITLEQLASHASGLDDVRFPMPAEAEAWFRTRPAWRRVYFERPDLRFHLALSKVPVIFEPETVYRYSGPGYYALACGLSSALQARSGEDLKHWLARRVYRPAGIPYDAWQISYDTSYPQDGLTRYAIGSGAAFTARALARIGQTVLDGLKDTVFSPLRTPLTTQAGKRSPGDPTPRAIPHLGWWGNEHAAWPSLPPDALVGLGVDDQVLLVVPSLEVVAVHIGRDRHWEMHFPVETGQRLEEVLFAPLIQSLRPDGRRGSPIGLDERS